MDRDRQARRLSYRAFMTLVSADTLAFAEWVCAPVQSKRWKLRYALRDELVSAPQSRQDGP